MSGPGARALFDSAALLAVSVLAFAFAGLGEIGQAAAAEVLSAAGARLQPAFVSPSVAAVSRAVDLDGDLPSATHVMLSDMDGRRLQRNRNGYWMPWDGRLDSLVDAGFKPANGIVVFKVVKQDISAAALPMRVTVAYRVGDQFKFGVFDVMPDQSEE